MQDINFNPGAIPDAPDPRNFTWGEQIGNTTVPFDWGNGYDVEKTLGFSLEVNDQNGSSSCGGQAISKKGEVLAALDGKLYKRKSAKFPYSQCFVPGGGSGAKALFDIYKNQGMGNEVDTTSYESGLPPSEPFMQRKSDITDLAREHAKKDKISGYAEVAINIDSIAQAIRDGKGVVIGLSGQNNNTWRTKFPKPPTSNDVWRHWVYAGKALMINEKKYIGFLNSWGSETGENGWQYISEDYIPWIWAVWTFIYENVQPDSLFTRTLRFRMKGDDVQKLQTILNSKGFNSGFPDGIFGNKTLNAVKAFQASKGLVVDGVVGKITQKALV